MNKKRVLKLGMFALFSILLISMVSATTSYCCEKVADNGPWCQNAPVEDCDPEYRKAPTSCEATSYCKLGCCYNSNEGTCMENTPQRICNQNNGVWSDDATCNVEQCDLGCCLIGGQAAFVTQTRCKRLSAIYGLGVNFRSDLQNEAMCILSATSDVEGACVFESEFEKSCVRTTRSECSSVSSDNGTEFFEGLLCSADELNTICGPSEQTTCVEGKDQVYFVDTCGNLANVYDYSKRDDTNYWREIKTIDEETCGFGESNAGSSECGNCDYFLGSTCKEWERSGTSLTGPDLGDNMCKDLGCEYEGEDYEHGETWCASLGGTSEIIFNDPQVTDSALENLPGSRYFRLLCYNNEVIVEPCSDYRQEVCIQSEVNDYKTAACRVNRWEDCISVDEQDDCENTDVRDCMWINPSYVNTNNDNGDDGLCVPRYAPGFDLAGNNNDGEDFCGLASTQCVVKYTRELNDLDFVGAAAQITGLGKADKTSWQPEKHDYCDPSDSGHQAWLDSMNGFCSSLGDCGATVNYLDYIGYNEPSDLVEISDDYLSEEELEEELS